MRLHNTLTGRKDPFTPLDPQRVTMYVCGPTVYSFAHIGNARPAVLFDVLARELRRRFPSVAYARNITDIDDKINKAAKDEGVDIGVITSRYAAAYHEDLAGLGVGRPDHEPRVTKHLPQILAMIQRLIESGHAYEAQGHVLFHTKSFERYGNLSGRDEQALMAGARIEVAPYKQHAGDFVLWKPSDADTPGWESPWGRGRPGWHIECSAMSEAVLGETIDIHGGGIDLIFPHHENEVAQSECAHGGKPFARWWVHNGFLTVNGEKMSKSIGNVHLVRDLLKSAPGEAIRLVLMTAHYRQPLDWTDEVLAESRKKLDRLYGALRELADVEEDPDAPDYAPFVEEIEDDLNTPGALAQLFELARAANTTADPAARRRIKSQLLKAGRVLGLLQQPPEAWFGWAPPRADLIAAEDVEKLLADRLAARKAKQWAESDRIRDELKAKGVLVEDSKDGQRWRYA
jgi:cysteinyl-tRNA synthetase